MNRTLFTETEWATVRAMVAADVPHDRIGTMLNISSERFRDTFWEILQEHKKVGGKKPLFFPDEKREWVRLAVMAGRTPGQVAEYLGLAEDTVRTHFAHEWRTATSDMVVRVSTAMYRKALSKEPGSVDAGKFVLSRRGGQAWTEKSMLDVAIGMKVGADVDLSALPDDELEALRALASRTVSEAKSDQDAEAVGEPQRITVEEPKAATETDIVNGHSEVGVVHGRGAETDQDLGGEPAETAGGV